MDKYAEIYKKISEKLIDEFKSWYSDAASRFKTELNHNANDIATNIAYLQYIDDVLRENISSENNFFPTCYSLRKTFVIRSIGIIDNLLNIKNINIKKKSWKNTATFKELSGENIILNEGQEKIDEMDIYSFEENDLMVNAYIYLHQKRNYVHLSSDCLTDFEEINVYSKMDYDLTKYVLCYFWEKLTNYRIDDESITIMQKPQELHRDDAICIANKYIVIQEQFNYYIAQGRKYKIDKGYDRTYIEDRGKLFCHFVVDGYPEYFAAMSNYTKLHNDHKVESPDKQFYPKEMKEYHTINALCLYFGLDFMNSLNDDKIKKIENKTLNLSDARLVQISSIAHNDITKINMMKKSKMSKNSL